MHHSTWFWATIITCYAVVGFGASALAWSAQLKLWPQDGSPGYRSAATHRLVWACVLLVVSFWAAVWLGLTGIETHSDKAIGAGLFWLVFAVIFLAVSGGWAKDAHYRAREKLERESRQASQNRW